MGQRREIVHDPPGGERLACHEVLVRFPLQSRGRGKGLGLRGLAAAAAYPFSVTFFWLKRNGQGCDNFQPAVES